MNTFWIVVTVVISTLDNPMGASSTEPEIVIPQLFSAEGECKGYIDRRRMMPYAVVPGQKVTCIPVNLERLYKENK